EEAVGGAARRREPVGRGEGASVLLHLVGAEELRPERRLRVYAVAGRGGPEAPGELEPSFDNRTLADGHAPTLRGMPATVCTVSNTTCGDYWRRGLFGAWSRRSGVPSPSV